FPGQHPLDGMVAGLDEMVVAQGEAELAAIRVDVCAKIFLALYPVQAERRFVRPEDRLVEIDEDDPLGQPCDQLLELAVVARGNGLWIRHFPKLGKPAPKIQTGTVGSGRSGPTSLIGRAGLRESIRRRGRMPEWNPS